MKLSPNRFKLMEYVHRPWHAMVEDGVTMEDLTRPVFWSHIARQLRYGDAIHVECENGKWEAELRVRDVGPTWARVVVYYRKDYAEPAAIEDVDTEGLEVKFAGPIRKHQVIRRKPNGFDILKEHIATKPEAVAWLQQFARDSHMAKAA